MTSNDASRDQLDGLQKARTNLCPGLPPLSGEELEGPSRAPAGEKFCSPVMPAGRIEG